MNINQIFKNNQITLHCSASKTKDNTNINANIFASNNTGSELTNVKLTLSVIKYVTLKVISTSSNMLQPNQSFGITKVS